MSKRAKVILATVAVVLGALLLYAIVDDRRRVHMAGAVRTDEEIRAFLIQQGFAPENVTLEIRRSRTSWTTKAVKPYPFFPILSRSFSWEQERDIPDAEFYFSTKVVLNVGRQ